ncbi:MAG: DUF935 family protein [Chthoniobacter sp.]|uniref:phage portal protein family protein n=1 Tax=Chthoniobacter sp. TaxID=2510640 RepID=UPI0032AD8DD5
MHFFSEVMLTSRAWKPPLTQPPAKRANLRSRLAGFARTALGAAAQRKPRPSSIVHRPLPAPPALSTIIRPQMRERWLLPQLSAITPTYIEMTLRGALAGAHIPQWELFNLMEDTWPRLRKNVLELKMAVRSRRAVLEAYRDEDEEKSPTATERMKLVSAALRQMQPDPTADEGAFDDLVGDILDAWFKGVSVLELDWHVAQTRALGRFVAPRAARWASPVQYVWDGDLRLGLADDTQQTLTPFPADRFIIAQCKTKSGSVLGGALLRPLVWWWCAANFSADWLLNLAQIFGLPVRWATYDPTAPQATVDQISTMLQNMGSASWGAFPNGTTLEVKAEGQKSGSETPQGDLLDRADKQCDLLVLGQTLTTDTGGMGQGGGSHALGRVHADVRSGIIDAAAKFAAGVIEKQLIPSILRLNYGDTDEAPTLAFHERGEDDLTARAHWISTLTAAGAGHIIPLDWLGKTFGIPKPEAGEMTLGDAKQQAQTNKATLAARISHEGGTEDAALEGGIKWNPQLHPKGKAGLFVFTNGGKTNLGGEGHEGFRPDFGAGGTTGKPSPKPKSGSSSPNNYAKIRPSDEKENPVRSRSVKGSLESALHDIRGDAPASPGHDELHAERQARVAREENQLRAWAEAHGKLKGRLPAEHARGGEHTVELVPHRGIVVKGTRPDAHHGYGIAYGSFSQGATPFEYLDRLHIHNRVFDDRVKLERIVRHGHKLSIVTSQPFVKGVPTVPTEIDGYMATKGFERLGVGMYYHADEGLLVHDMVERNVIKDAHGIIHPIDPAIQRVSPDFVHFLKHHWIPLHHRALQGKEVTDGRAILAAAFHAYRNALV